jgi:hypothetical protein
LRVWLLLPVLLALCGCAFFPLTGAQRADAPLGSSNERIEHVWRVPAGTGVAEVVVGWSRPGRCAISKVMPAGRCYGLTVRRRVGPSTTLFSHSPFPFEPTSVRTADVTGDGHKDLLVTIECSECNHAAAAAAVYADVGGRMRLIYGNGFIDSTVGASVPGRPITETAWGARRGMVWFDVPHYGPQSSICCPDYRVQTFLRWAGDQWRTVRTVRVSPDHAYLDNPPVPAP